MSRKIQQDFEKEQAFELSEFKRGKRAYKRGDPYDLDETQSWKDGWDQAEVEHDNEKDLADWLEEPIDQEDLERWHNYTDGE